MKSVIERFGAGLTLCALTAGLATAGCARGEKTGTPAPREDAAKKASRAAEKKIEETLHGRSVARTAADVAISARVKSTLIEDASVTASDIDIDTLNGIVYLRGSIGSKAEAQKAYAMALRTFGVKAVKNQLQIVSSGKAASQSAKSKPPAKGKN